MTATAELQRAPDVEALIAATRANDKPGLDEMLDWVRGYDTCLTASAELYTMVYGDVEPPHVRTVAVVRQLAAFLSRCSECPDEIANVFRAVEYRKQWRRR